MSTEAQMMQILHSLKVISTIKENDKVATNNGMYIDTSVWQSMSRWFSKEARDQNVEKIGAVFQRAFAFCEGLLDTPKSTDIEELQTAQSLNRLQREIASAQTGLLNLTVTYENDTSTVARIQALHELTTDRLEQLEYRRARKIRIPSAKKQQ
jgi:hypothetical protein